MWLDPMFLKEVLEIQFYNGNDMDKIAYICNGLQIFYACLGPYMTACLSIKGLTTAKHMDPYSAYGYLGLFNLWRFQCGAGFYALEKTGSLKCVQNTMKNRLDTMNQLLETYRGNVMHDPTHACKEAATLEDSFRLIYAQNSMCQQEQKGDVAGWWACEGQKEYTEAEFRECSHVNKCELVRKPKPPAAKDLELVKFVNGEMKIKIGPSWKKTPQGEWYQEPEKWV